MSGKALPVGPPRTVKLKDPEDWGHINYLEKHEIEAFEELKKKVLAAGLTRYAEDTKCLLRFLRARKFSVKKALYMVKEDDIFRGPFRKINFGLADFSSLMIFVDDGVIHQGGRDKEGRPVIYCMPGLFFPSMITDEEELVKFYVFYMDSLLRMADEKDREDFTVIADLKGWSFKNFSMPLVRLLVNILQNYYPERLGRVMVLNAPMLFRGAWNLISPLLDERTRMKIHLKSGFDKIREIVDVEVLEEDYGGKHEQYPFRDPIIAPLFEVIEVSNPEDDFEDDHEDNVSLQELIQETDNRVSDNRGSSPRKSKKVVSFSRMIKLLSGNGKGSKLLRQSTSKFQTENNSSVQVDEIKIALNNLNAQFEQLRDGMLNAKMEQDALKEQIKTFIRQGSAGEDKSSFSWPLSLQIVLIVMFAVQCWCLQLQMK